MTFRCLIFWLAAYLPSVHSAENDPFADLPPPPEEASSTQKEEKAPVPAAKKRPVPRRRQVAPKKSENIPDPSPPASTSLVSSTPSPRPLSASAPTVPEPEAPSPFSGTKLSKMDLIKELHAEYLGRTAEIAHIQQWLQRAQALGMDAIVREIQTSPEASQYLGKGLNISSLLTGKEFEVSSYQFFADKSEVSLQFDQFKSSPVWVKSMAWKEARGESASDAPTQPSITSIEGRRDYLRRAGNNKLMSFEWKKFSHFGASARTAAAGGNEKIDLRGSKVHYTQTPFGEFLKVMELKPKATPKAAARSLRKALTQASTQEVLQPAAECELVSIRKNEGWKPGEERVQTQKLLGQEISVRFKFHGWIQGTTEKLAVFTSHTDTQQPKSASASKPARGPTVTLTGRYVYSPSLSDCIESAQKSERLSESGKGNTLILVRRTLIPL